MSRLSKLIIWGAGGHGAVVLDILRQNQEYELVGWLDNISPERTHQQHRGLKVLGGEECLMQLEQLEVTHFIVAIGDCYARERVARIGEAAGLQLARAIHPRAYVAPDADLGDGVVVAAQAVVAPGTVLGRNVIVNHGATVDHDCRLGDGTHVCPGAHLAGHVTTGTCVWIGIGANVIDRVNIGDGTIVGAGATVIGDLPGSIIAHGIPARPYRKAEI